ncbi:MAG: MucR family transcriptional regulator, partial [Pseudomonadota bacterium]|nr:MucR family transcriptional regulator [Pseudomonadota bacterium]
MLFTHIAEVIGRIILIAVMAVYEEAERIPSAAPEDIMTDVAPEPSDLTGMTAAIVSAYVMKNRREPQQVANLVLSVHQALTGVGGEAAPE